MDFNAIGENVPLIVSIIGLVLLQFFLMRRRKPERTQQEIAQSLLSEVKLNQALVETFGLRQKPKKFEIASWRRNKAKLDFLEQSLQKVLSNVFGMAEDFNQQIEAAKKYKSASYMVSVDVGKLREPLNKSQKGLEEWFLTKTGGKELPPKYPGMLDDFLGGKR